MSLIPNVNVPEGKKGNWSVEKFTVSKREADFNNLRAIIGGDRPILPGTYTRLMRGHTVVMSDTPAEKGDHRWPVVLAKGHCLLNGLGLGMVLNAMLLKSEVTKVTVVELSQDVIDLVAPHYVELFGSRVEIVHASAFDYKPPAGVRYGVVWHDIWDAICADNLEQMTKLKRKYGRRTDHQRCWCEAECYNSARRWR